ncbi:glycosyl hydrolase family 85-domain-containing protein [Chlamydoabsidia padenii]|nr:glycosyl hydrolase family 85-domain-containing protein [Chlamydoabsidia padenii]
MPSRQLQQDKDVHLPVSKPLSSMKQLKEWDANQAQDVANIASTKLHSRPVTRGTQGPRLLLCHDMAGGYKEDLWIQGNNYDTIYNIQYWEYVDSFIYFSHERVTIPPVNWINTCHRNGVVCLGTFIVEGDQMGELEMLLQGPPDAPVLGDKDPMRLWNPYYADKLVAIAKHYGFDGWLMNIECSFMPFPTPVQEKAQQLTWTKLHEEIPGSTLLWYDSLTRDGIIDWQNQLTEDNLPFFKVTDGIFLNYWWRDDYPKKASELAESVGRRGTDVYFGTDVWGRGTHGGGEFNSYKGVEDSSKGGASAALFGMAWTYEHFNKQNFDLMDRLFWKGGKPSEFPPSKTELGHQKDEAVDLVPHGYHPGAGETKQPSPGTNWFASCFDRGYGTKFYLHGKELLNEPWSHLSHQSIPANLTNLTKMDGTDAYNGGSSLILQCYPPHPIYKGGDTHTATSSAMLYNLSLDIDPSLIYQLCYAYKPMPEAAKYDHTLKCVLREHIVATDSTETQDLHHIDCTDGRNNNGKDGLHITKTTTEAMNNGWMLQKINFEFITTENYAKRTIDQLGFMVAIISEQPPGKDHTNKIDLVRIGLVSIAPMAIDENETRRFDWGNIRWEQTGKDDDRNHQKLTFWGTLDWHWKNNRKGDEIPEHQLERQQDIPDWCRTNYALVYLTSTKASDDDIFLGTSFSSLFRISGVDLTTDASCRKLIKIKMVDNLGRLQSTHTIDLPSIVYYT